MHTGKRNPLQLPEDEQYDKLSTQLISGKFVHNQNKFIFPALNSKLHKKIMTHTLILKVITHPIIFLKPYHTPNP